jgi:hypothetical protein
VSTDYALPDAALAALSQFCRVAPEKIQELDLRQQVCHLSSARLLRYHQNLSVGIVIFVIVMLCKFGAS